MPHCLVEYSDNLAAQGDIAGLLRKIAARYADSGGLFPPVGIRVRAICVTEHVVADGKQDYGFVHLTCKIAPGRPETRIADFFGDMFEMVKDHFADLFESRPLGLSLDVETAAEGASYKYHNIGPGRGPAAGPLA